jgi:hypothetical protein
MTSPFMVTASGREYFLAGPAALVGNPPDIKDIAHHLAQLNRFTGACSRPYSVAEHSLLVERIGAARGASPTLRLALLLHDAHEAYTNDQSSPAKIAVGTSWTSFEAYHAANARHYFGLKTAFAAHRAEIRHCDLVALATERRDLLPWDREAMQPWPPIDTAGNVIEPCAEQLDPNEPPLTWRELREAFISKYLLLREMQQAQQRSHAHAQ